jgi:hypothetical protein
MKFLPSQAPFRVRRLADGRIRPGQAVRLSYDAYFFTRLSGYWQSAPCVACEALYTDYYEPAIDKAVAELHPRIVNIDADEIRGFYRDSRMQRRFRSNAQAIAYWANRIRAHLAERDPAARLWIWDDMVSPYHNGGVADYQVDYGGLPGRMAEATEKDWIDKSVLMDVWWYSDDWLSQMWQSVGYFTRKGYQVLGSPWLDPANIVSWSELLVDRPGALGGVETNWGTPFEEAHMTFADNFWNTRYRTVRFDSFETDADGDAIPDGWSASGPIDYSTDGTMAHGRRYAGFPNGAVGMVTDTQRISSAPIPVRPNTTHLLSAHLRRAPGGSTSATLRLAWLDASGTEIAADSAPVEDIGTAYAEVTLPASSPNGAASCVVRLDGPAPGVWLDVVRLREETRFTGIVGPAALPGGTVGDPYQASFTAAGGVPPRTWAVAAGRLPRGLALRPNGTVEGVPASPGAYALTVRVVDAAQRADQREYRIEIARGVQPSAVFLPAAQRD